jgi:hypothetical protein
MDAETKEFLRLCDVTIAEAERVLDHIHQGAANPALLDDVNLLIENLWALRKRAEAGQLIRPSRGAGFGMSRAVGEWAEGFSALMKAIYALENFYRDHM